MWNIEERALGETKAYIGSDLQREVLPRLELIIEEGAICVVYDKNVAALAQQIRDALKLNYRLFAKCISSQRNFDGKENDFSDVPEFVRHVFAVGAGAAATCAKQLAKKLGIDWSIYLTAPSTDTVACDIPPKTVFIDKNVLINCPFECVASGYGIILARQMTAFEDFFADKVLADHGVKAHTVNYDGTASDSRQDGAMRTQRPVDMPVHELAYELLRCADVGDSVGIISGILYRQAQAKGRRPRLMGEYRFLAAAMLLNFYSNFLGAPSLDVIPPACRDIAFDKLSELKISTAILPKKVDFFDINSYFRISYILGEYRMDLLDKLGGIDIRASQRFWRRLYPDAGYWLKSELSVRDMLEALTLAGALSDGLLGFAFASGVLNVNLPCKGSV